MVPWGLVLSKNQGLSNWNKMVKPNSRDFKPFWEANNWVEHKEGFMIALEAQNLTHLVDKTHTVVDPDLAKAQQKHLHKVMKDAFIHHEAKSIVKMCVETKDARVIWEQACKVHDESVSSTSMNGDAILGWLPGVQLHKANWNRAQGKSVTFCSMRCALTLLLIVIRPFQCFRMSSVALPISRTS